MKKVGAVFHILWVVYGALYIYYVVASKTIPFIEYLDKEYYSFWTYTLLGAVLPAVMIALALWGIISLFSVPQFYFDAGNFGAKTAGVLLVIAAVIAWIICLIETWKSCDSVIGAIFFTVLAAIILFIAFVIAILFILGPTIIVLFDDFDEGKSFIIGFIIMLVCLALLVFAIAAIAYGIGNVSGWVWALIIFIIFCLSGIGGGTTYYVFVVKE